MNFLTIKDKDLQVKKGMNSLLDSEMGLRWEDNLLKMNRMCSYLRNIQKITLGPTYDDCILVEGAIEAVWGVKHW